MKKMWTGRTDGNTDSLADDFNSSIAFDSRFWKQDIDGSIAHAAMLGKQHIIEQKEADAIIEQLHKIQDEIGSGALKIDLTSEDIHMFVEQELTKRLGDVGKKLHTARSRNDQVALDMRLYLRDEAAELKKLMLELLAVILKQAKANETAVMPGYTHLQRAQPIVMAQQLLAYAQMIKRDIGRLDDACARMNQSPLGSCALAGTTYDTDREFTASQLGFDGICENSLDAVSDRDFCAEFLFVLSLVMMHLSRFSEEIILWSSWEFHYVELDDAYTTGSSIMPQKKNADMAELVRGKTGRVYGDLVAMLTVLKGLPLAYNKDMQEDKESVFDALDTVKACLSVFIPMLDTMKTCPENMKKAAQTGFINATDLADYLVCKGVPFRSAYKAAGEAVRYCIGCGKTLEQLSMEEFSSFHELIGPDVYEVIDLDACVARRISAGGTGPASVRAQIESLEKYINQL